MTRADGRSNDELRPITMQRGWLDHAAGSVLIEFGGTRVLCAASASEGVPRWRKGSGLGWVTAEYSMLPRATHTRSDRESVKGEPLTGSVAAVSVGIIDGVPRLDLPYEEDVRAETDMNVVMTGDGRFVEVQGTAEGEPFDRALLDQLLALAAQGCAELTELQKTALAS